MKAVQLYVKGKVQGVFYRASTVDVAKKLGVTGWVKNQPDGSVKIHAQGSVTAIDELILWAWQGPKNAKVTAVDTVVVAADDFITFNVLR